MKIRRRADRDAAPDAAPEPAQEVTLEAAPAPSTATMPLPSVAPPTVAPVPVAAPVAAPEPAKAPAPEPPAHARAAAADGRARVWRDEAAQPRVADDEPAPSRATPLAPEDFPSTDDFAAMLGAGPLGVRSYDVGDKVTGTVVAIGNDAVFVALGGKTEGAIDSAELLDRDGQLTVSVGDSLEAYVVTVRGGVRLSRALGKGGGEHLAILEDAARQGIPVEGRVTGVNKGGFDVQALGARGFCPFSQIDLGSGAEPET